jgi:hypothetical protein
MWILQLGPKILVGRGKHERKYVHIIIFLVENTCEGNNKARRLGR